VKCVAAIYNDKNNKISAVCAARNELMLMPMLMPITSGLLDFWTYE
jgi:hypothetical protein